MHAARFQEGDPRGGPPLHGAFGINLTSQGAVGHHRDLGKVAFGRHSGARIDEAMHGVAPAPPGNAAGADRPVRERDHRAVAEADVPAVAFRSGTVDPEVAAQVADPIVTELINKDVGQRSLDDSAKIERGRRSQRRRAGRLIQDQHLRQARQGQRIDEGRLGQTLAEWPVIAGGDERRQHGRIDQAVALFKRPERGFQHRK